LVTWLFRNNLSHSNTGHGVTAFLQAVSLSLLLGIGGVAVLVSRGISLAESPIDTAGACGLIAAAIGWSIASALTRKLPLPASKAMSSGAQMLAGGVLLTLIAGILGEFRSFRVQAVSSGAWLALAYLIVAGSIVAFTAYVWLIHHESPTKVGTYAYVNPVMAVLLGYFLGGEALGQRTIAGTALVLVSVVVITTAPKKTEEEPRKVPHEISHPARESAGFRDDAAV